MMDRLMSFWEIAWTQMHAEHACVKFLLPCGHRCGGVRNENPCLPCINPTCVRAHRRGSPSSSSSANALSCKPDSDVAVPDEEPLKQDGDDMCMVCFSDSLASAPTIRLGVCRHLFHYHCCRRALEAKWPGPRISFGFTLCPICKTKIEHPALGDLLEPVRTLHDDVRRKALMRLKYEGLDR